MLVVAGLNLSNLHPHVWDADSPYFLSRLSAVMLSYAEFHNKRARRRTAIEQGLHASLGVPTGMPVYLDNGAFYFLRRNGVLPFDEYEAFVQSARPDWFPIPRDFIPSPGMSLTEQRALLEQTMQINQAYVGNGYVPVIHAGLLVREYVDAYMADDRLANSLAIGIGGLVPNLLRAPKAIPYRDVLASLIHVRRSLPETQVHLFGVGGTATLHLAALLGANSVDSSGWRNRAARGIVQLPGRGDRMVAELGRWRGRVPNDDEWQLLADCACPVCQRDGLAGLRASGLSGFCHRATHNLWTLLEEAHQINAHLADGTYQQWYPTHVSNSTYKPLIDVLVQELQSENGTHKA